MTFAASIRDTMVVAWFSLSRAMRTRSAIALCSVYFLVAAGAAWVSARTLRNFERAMAETMGVPKTERAGAMLDVLAADNEFREMLGAMIGDPTQVDWALSLPFLSITHFWSGFGFVPFLAAAVGAQAVAPDVSSRFLRFELLRTGRLVAPAAPAF